jgi:hypothetical protein
MPKRKPMTEVEAEALALSALAFLAEEPERLGRFLSLTGLGPDSLRAGLADPSVLAAIIGHLRGDESLLLVFSASAGVAPERLIEAEMLLGGHPPG